MEWTPIRNQVDLDALIAEPAAILFIWVDWGTAVTSRAHMTKALEKWVALHPGEQVPCYVVDLSEQSGELWEAMLAWLVAQQRPAGQVMMSGAGPVLWLKCGHVVMHVINPLQFEVPKLATACHSVFSPDA